MREALAGLDYDSAWHMHCALTLRSGRVVTLEALSQSQTYAGWLEGEPQAGMNRRIIEAAVPVGAILIEPLRRNYLRQPDGAPVPAAEPAEWLPLVTCTARLASAQGVKDATRGSSLTVVWFQDEFAMPIEPTVLEHIRSLAWDKLAVDHDE